MKGLDPERESAGRPAGTAADGPPQGYCMQLFPCCILYGREGHPKRHRTTPIAGGLDSPKRLEEYASPSLDLRRPSRNLAIASSHKEMVVL